MGDREFNQAVYHKTFLNRKICVFFAHGFMTLKETHKKRIWILHLHIFELSIVQELALDELGYQTLYFGDYN